MRRLMSIGLVVGVSLGFSTIVMVSPVQALEFLATNQVKAKFKFTSGEAVLETVLVNKEHLKITCTSDKGKGKLSGPKTVAIEEYDLSSCKQGLLRCNTAGDPAEVILIPGATTGVLGFIKSGNPLEVGLAVKLAQNIVITCGGVFAYEIRGGFIGLIPSGDINRNTKEFKLEFKQQEGVQKPVKFEGGEKMSLEYNVNGTFVQAGLANTETIELTEPGIEVTIDG